MSIEPGDLFIRHPGGFDQHLAGIWKAIERHGDKRFGDPDSHWQMRRIGDGRMEILMPHHYPMECAGEGFVVILQLIDLLAARVEVLEWKAKS